MISAYFDEEGVLLEELQEESVKDAEQKLLAVENERVSGGQAENTTAACICRCLQQEKYMTT